MFAVIKTGGKQYRVAAEDVITIAKLEGEPGQAVAFDNVILFANESGTQVGAPTLAGISVAGEVVKQTRGPKVIAFKKRRRQNSRRKRGHRQDLTVVRITDILLAGQERRRHGTGSAEASIADASGADVSAADMPAAHAPEAVLAEAGAA